MKKYLFLLLILQFCSASLVAQNCGPVPPSDDQMHDWCYDKNVAPTNWDTSVIPAKIINGLPFRLVYPKNYDPNNAEKYPLVVVLHGIGESGTDNNLQLSYGGRAHYRAVQRGDYNGFVMFPQSPSQQWSSTSRNNILDFVRYAIKNLNVDELKVQVEGYSSGGTATWTLIADNPLVFSGAIPMSAATGSNTDTYVEILKYSPVWHSQGGRDGTVSPSAGNRTAEAFKAAGANYKYQYYPTVGHNTWNSMYTEPGFYSFLNNSSQLSIHVLYFKQNFCEGEAVTGTMGVTAGFEGYEWRKDGALLTGENGHELVFNSLGSYTVRIQYRNVNGQTVWSPWSEPMVIQRVSPTATPTVTAGGPTALPSLDGRTTVTLRAPKGYQQYLWSTGATTDSIIVNSAGSYTVQVTEALGCISAPSAPVKVTYNAGYVVAAPGNMAVATVNESQLSISWTDMSRDETGFELYRSISPDGPWSLVAMIPANTTTYADQGLETYTRYFYSLRAVNQNGGSEYVTADGKTSTDNSPPTTPTNLEAYYTSREGIHLRWNPSSDASTDLVYEIYSNKTTLVATTSSTDFKVTGLEERQVYNLAVLAKDVAGNRSEFSNQVTAATVVDGLLYSYYEKELTTVDGIYGLQPLKKEKIPNVTIEVRERQDRYALKFEGFISIPANGAYTFTTISDDGSTLSIDGKLVVDNDGNHGPETQQGTAELTAGFHPITILYYDKGGSTDTLNLTWAGPTFSKQVIPDAVFKEDFTMPAPPAAPSNVSAAAVDHQSIILRWQDNSNNESNFEIFRSTSNSGPFAFVKSVAANSTEYTDTSLQPETRYYYQLKAVGTTGESELAGKNGNVWVNATTDPAVAAPAAPTGLTASMPSPTSVQLSWVDNANDETGFEIFRNDVLLTQTAENTSSYLDESISSGTQYTYKVRAYHSGAASAFSNTVIVNGAGNNAPELAEIGTVHANVNATTTVQIFAEDAEDDALTYSATGLPAFSSLSTNPDGTATLTVSPATEDAGTYDGIVIKVTDSFGGEDSETISIVVGDNTPPGIMSISSVTLNEKERRTVEVRAYDGNGDIVRLELVSPPAFASFTDRGNNTGAITLAPEYPHAAEYVLAVKATDPLGASTVVRFSVTVSDVITDYTVKLNFNDHIYQQAAAPWNNFSRYPAAGNTVNNLKDTDNRVTPVDVSILDNFGRNETGATTGTNTGVYPDAVLQTCYYGWDDAPRRIRVGGLDPDLIYTFTLLGSYDGTNGGATEYTINGVSKRLNVEGNTTATVTFADLTAPEGELIITVKRTAEEQFSYINALVVDSRYEDTTVPHAPSDLIAATNQTGVLLQWTDIASNETGFEIHRGTDGSTFTQIGTTATNITSYSDNTATANTSYYYRVRAVNANGASGWSNTIQVNEGNPGPDPDNAAPVIENFPEVVSAVDGTTTTLEFTLYDPEGEPLELIFKNLPSFATIEHVDSNTGLITLTPTTADIGVYTGIQFTATDGVMESDVVFKIVVSNSEKTSTYVNFGESSTAALPWNNVNAPATTAGTMLIENLLDETGNNTGYDIYAISGFTYGKDTSFSRNFGATAGDNYGIFPDEVMASAYLVTKSNTASFKVTGLKAGVRYNFLFFGSSAYFSKNGSTKYTIGSTTATLAVQDNIRKTVQINGLQADANGELIVEVQADSDASKGGYINAMVIEEYPDTGELLRPGYFDAYAVSDISAAPMIRLSWTDNNYQETGYEIWKRELPSGDFTLLTTTPANTTGYTDANLPENTGYEYTVRAVNASSESEYSSNQQAATLLYEVYVNMDAGSLKGSTPPWNNLDAEPYVGESWFNLQKAAGGGSNISLDIETNFDGGNSFGPSANGAGIYEDNVIKYFYFVELGNVGKLHLYGLDDNLTYNFRLFGASAFGTENGPTEYRIGTKKALLDVQNNISNTTVIRDVRPVNGNVHLEVEGSFHSRYGYLTAMVIEARDGSKETNGANSNARMITDTYAEKGATATTNQVTSLYPNPVQDEFSVDFVSQSEGACVVQVMDLRGRTIHTQNVTAKEGKNTFTIDIRNPAIGAGMYILRVKSMDFESKVVRFMKQ